MKALLSFLVLVQLATAESPKYGWKQAFLQDGLAQSCFIWSIERLFKAVQERTLSSKIVPFNPPDFSGQVTRDALYWIKNRLAVCY
jgi:hypothetical protein